MNRSYRKKLCVMLMVACCFLVGATGCNQDVIGEVVALSGAYVGDVVTAAVTGALSSAFGVEGAAEEHEHEDEHSHSAEPLHDHDH